MAGTRASIEAGRGHVTLGVDKSPLEKGLDAAAARLKSFGASTFQLGASIAAAGTLITGAFLGSLMAFVDIGSQLQDMSDRTGVAVEELSALRFAAEQSSATAEDLQTGMRAMSNFLDAANQGSSTARRALDELGISLNELNSMSQTQRFMRFADAIARIEDPAKRSALAADIFSRSGMALMPMLRQGSAGLRDMMQNAERLGVVMSGEDAAAAEALGDQFSALGTQIKFLAVQIGAAIAPLAKEFLTPILNIIGGVVHWIKENRELVRTIFFVGLSLVAIGGTIMAIGGAIIGVGLVCAALSTALAGLAAAAPIAGVALLGLIGFLIGTVAPIMAVVGAVYLLAKAFPELVEEVEWAAGVLLKPFVGLMRGLKDVFNVIKQHLLGGDLEGAFETFTVGVKLMWARWTNDLKNIWFAFVYAIPTVLNTNLERVRRMLARVGINVGSMQLPVVSQSADRTEEQRLQRQFDQIRARGAFLENREMINAMLRQAFALMYPGQGPVSEAERLLRIGSFSGEFGMGAAKLQQGGVVDPMAALLRVEERGNRLLEDIRREIANVDVLRAQ